MSTSIEWTDATWNPVTGCTKVSAGCKHCYAETIANRKLPQGGFTERPFTEVRTHPDRLDAPLHWRKPRRVFVNSMSDLFHEDVDFGFISAVFRTCMFAEKHAFQVLTKRPERMLEYSRHVMREKPQHGPASGERMLGWSWPLPNVWLGVSVENQATADKRIPILLQTPAAVRFVSYEPALGPVDFRRLEVGPRTYLDGLFGFHEGVAGPGTHEDNLRELPTPLPPILPGLDWVIVGGESGPGARPFDLAWARIAIEQCKEAGVACFVKQLGACPYSQGKGLGQSFGAPRGVELLELRDRKGGDMSEWPADLRVREFPV